MPFCVQLHPPLQRLSTNGLVSHAPCSGTCLTTRHWYCLQVKFLKLTSPMRYIQLLSASKTSKITSYVSIQDPPTCKHGTNTYIVARHWIQRLQERTASCATCGHETRGRSFDGSCQDRRCRTECQQWTISALNAQYL